MKTTKYFEFRRQFPDRQYIQEAWIMRVLGTPFRTEKQEDGRFRMWGKIEEADEKWLRVVVLEDSETVHNTFFDRSFRE